VYRCPTCVSVLTDATVRRCPVCGENFRRHPPVVLGANRRSKEMLTSWDIRSSSEASKLYGQETRSATEPDIDLPKEHRRDSSGRTAATDHG
jgi:hypothetical protein